MGFIKAQSSADNYFWIESTDSLTFRISSNTQQTFYCYEGSPGTDLKYTIASGTSYTLDANTRYYLYGVSDVDVLFSTSNTSNAWTFTTSGQVSLGGNVMALLGDHTKDTVGEQAFNYMFYNNTTVTDVSALKFPAQTLSTGAYTNMFRRATGLVNASFNLPALTCPEDGYYSMFYSCSSLVYAPTISAESMDLTSCYQMFYNCTSLLEAPELPATTLGQACYQGMFYGCTSLVKAPSVLPAQDLRSQCYSQMFYNCSSLTESPILAARTVYTSYGSYYNMFRGCSSLNRITCLCTGTVSSVTGISGFSETYWVYGVADEGTFVKHPDVTWSSGNTYNMMPEGWTQVDYEGEWL